MSYRFPTRRFAFNSRVSPHNIHMYKLNAVSAGMEGEEFGTQASIHVRAAVAQQRRLIKEQARADVAGQPRLLLALDAQMPVQIESGRVRPVRAAVAPVAQH